MPIAVAMIITLVSLLGIPWAAGDMNTDGAVNGLDVDPFVDALLSNPCSPNADCNGDGMVTGTGTG